MLVYLCLSSTRWAAAGILCALMLLYVCSHASISVSLVNALGRCRYLMRSHVTICVFSYYYICVFSYYYIYMFTYYYICVPILQYECDMESICSLVNATR